MIYDIKEIIYSKCTLSDDIRYTICKFVFYMHQKCNNATKKNILCAK